ncbi:hypothetical protein MYVALT_G_00850 [Candidatus Vallotia tarda]|uniref:Uncharacterized protein n=1 Tax=Candidatus Vallotiella hemipterorum TaxID=1177213 RepID=A0A916NK41_9BURK|nr:hypothetical protein MYVALT_G_00850 [Candidatus Vallotia tarda]
MAHTTHGSLWLKKAGDKIIDFQTNLLIKELQLIPGQKPHRQRILNKLSTKYFKVRLF